MVNPLFLLLVRAKSIAKTCSTMAALITCPCFDIAISTTLRIDVVAYFRFLFIVVVMIVATLQLDRSSQVAAADIDFPVDMSSLTLQKDVLGRALPWWCIVENVPVYKSRSSDSQVIDRLGYLESIYVALENAATRSQTMPDDWRDKDHSWCLVGVISRDGSLDGGEPKWRGWVQRKYLLERLRAEKSQETYIAKKACIVTPASIVKEAIALKVDIPPLKPRWRPTKTALAGDPVSNANLPELVLYRLFFVYAELDDELLLCTKQQLNESRNAKTLSEDLIGWVPSDRVARWNTRECMQWDRLTRGSRPAGTLYLAADEAIRAFKAGSAEGDLPEPEDLLLGSGAMRFHLLTTAPEAQKKGVSGAVDWGQDGNSLVELGAVLLPDRSGIDQTDIDSQVAKIDQLAEETAETELLFVIDDTGSMDIAFTAAAEIVESIWNEVRTTADVVRVGVAYYADGNDQQAFDLSDNKLLRLTDAEALGLSQRMKRHQIRSDPNNDPLERVLDGIIHAYSGAGFKRHTRKIVVVLGDCGDRAKMTPDAIRRIEFLADQLVPKEEGFAEFHVIQLKDPNQDPAWGYFRDQLGVKLKEEYKRRMDSVFQAYNDRPNVDDFFTYSFLHIPNKKGAVESQQLRDFVQSKIIPRFNVARTMGSSFRTAIKLVALEGGGSDRAVVKVEGARASDAILKRIYELDGVDQFLQKYRGVQPYQRVYGWTMARTETPISQLQQMVLVNDAELNTAIRLLDSLETLFADGGRDVSLESIISQVLAAQGGEKVDVNLAPRDQADLLFKSLRFSSKAVSKILGQGTLNDSDLFELYRKRDLLRDISENKKAEADRYMMVKTEQSGVAVILSRRMTDPTTGKPYAKSFENRSFERAVGSDEDAGKKVRWYYISFEQEWP
ncbi:MAG TPA: hypothetical protein DDZ51_22785 [Planctomycetaceae bacterium]|nr:hypothetical protein [Planctomycetaceae bacterium]